LSAAIDTGLCAVLAAAQGWIDAANLDRVALPGGLGELQGALGEATLQLSTRRHVGGGFAALTVASIRDDQGRLRSATLIGLPEPATLAPVLGVDLIGFGGALSLVAVDLSPTDDAAWAGQAAPLLARLHAAVGDHGVPRRWPAFAAEVFSSQALIVGVRRGAEEPVLAAVAEFVADVAAVFGEPRTTQPERVAAVAARVVAWRRAELANRREHDALARIFGQAAAADYLEMLFGGGRIS
jgi:hypothetical protein